MSILAGFWLGLTDSLGPPLGILKYLLIASDSLRYGRPIVLIRPTATILFKRTLALREIESA